MTRWAVAALAVAVAVFAGCGGKTLPATKVTATSAQLNAQGHCDPNDEGRIFYEYRRQGTSTWTRVTPSEPRVLPDSDGLPDSNGAGSAVTDPCTARIPASGDVAISGAPAAGLSPGTTYEYRVGFRFESNGTEAWVDSTGAVNPSSPVYSTFTTCDRYLTSDPGSTSAFSGLGSGDVLCLAPGVTFDWSNGGMGYTPPSGIEIRSPEGNGGSVATVAGEAKITNANVTLRNLKLTPGTGNSHSVVDVDANGFTGQYLDIDQQHVQDVQGLFFGDTSHTPTNPRLLDSIVHGGRGDYDACGGAPEGRLAHSQVHGIYWFASSDGEATRDWFYDEGGYGLHFSGGARTGVTADQVIVAKPFCHRGFVWDSAGGSLTANHTISSGSSVDSPGWWCKVSGATVNNSRSEFWTGCSGSGNVTGSTTFTNESSNPPDLTVPSDLTNYGFKPGPR